jgi:hypothetical protein
MLIYARFSFESVFKCIQYCTFILLPTKPNYYAAWKRIGIVRVRILVRRTSTMKIRWQEILARFPFFFDNF